MFQIVMNQHKALAVGRNYFRPAKPPSLPRIDPTSFITLPFPFTPFHKDPKREAVEVFHLHVNTLLLLTKQNLNILYKVPKVFHESSLHSTFLY
jgi:hypothetical protein